jgi:hypothetical protein
MPPYALGLYDLLSTLDQDTRQFLVDNDDIDVASTHLVEEPAEGRAVHVAAREATVIELVDDVKAGIAAAREALAIATMTHLCARCVPGPSSVWPTT